MVLKWSNDEFSLTRLFCSIFLKFVWDVMFLYELSKLFHRRHALEWNVLSPEFLLHDGVRTSLYIADLVR